jgi:Ser/Thr protein kinase RdoA (MazF antagonist)
LFPVVQSLLSPQGLLALVEAEHDLGTPLECDLWFAGVTNTYRVATARGSYALRVYRTGHRTDGEVAYELDAVRHLAGKGVPIAVPVPRADGAWFRSVEAPEGPRRVAPEGPRRVALFAWAPGREAHREEGYSLRYGRAVAELHDASDDFRSAYPRFRLDAGTLLDRPLSRIEPRLAHRPDDRAYLLGLAARPRERLARLPAAELEWGFCHGDTLGSNAHLDGDTIVHFDLDDCAPGWRAYDLATYRWIWTWRTPEAAEARWAEFLAGYRERRPTREST